MISTFERKSLASMAANNSVKRSLVIGNSVKRALVIGNGVGGLSSAAMLARAGWAVTVRTSSATDAHDDAIGIWSNALAALDAQLSGAGAELSARGVYVQRVSGYHDGAGRRLCGPMRPLGDSPSGSRPALLFVRRSALLEVLHDACSRESVKFRAEAEDEAAAEADLVVGADGAHSGARARYFPTAPALREWGFHVFRGIATGGSSLLPHGGASFQAWAAGARRFAAVPAPRGSAAWFATARGTPPGACVHNVAERRRVVAELTSSFEPCARALLDATPDAELAAPEAALAHPAGAGARLSACGRVVLVGDAAHTLDPILAQGAGVAIEDAAQLASSTQRWLPSDGRPALARALQEYAAIREARVRALAAISCVPDALGQMESTTLRDTAMRMIPSPLSALGFEIAMAFSLAPSPMSGRWRYQPPHQL